MKIKSSKQMKVEISCKFWLDVQMCSDLIVMILENKSAYYFIPV